MRPRSRDLNFVRRSERATGDRFVDVSIAHVHVLELKSQLADTSARQDVGRPLDGEGRGRLGETLAYFEVRLEFEGADVQVLVV